MSATSLFAALRVGRYTLSHRVVMAPLTRMRANAPSNVPNDLAAEYYCQRASAGGLIIAEATQVVPSGQGFPATPGIHSAEQIVGWKKVTDAVHAKGGLIFLQLWHVGRAALPVFQPGGAKPVAPSAIAAEGAALTPDFKPTTFEAPRALETKEVADVVEGFRLGASNAMKAGFDGVEVHGANGFLIEQFLQSRSNQRTDAYGGSIENRSRFLLEVTKAVVDVWGADRVGVRLSPFGRSYGAGEAEPIPLYSHAISELSKLGLAYLHLIEFRDNDAEALGGRLSIDELRPFWKGTFIAAGGFSNVTAASYVESGKADAIAFGRHFLANPDLPERLKVGAPLNSYNRATFYGGSAEGYTDYPTLKSTTDA